MVDLLRYRATSERNFIEQIKAPIFLEAVLAKEMMLEPQFNLEDSVQRGLIPTFKMIPPFW